MPPPPWEGNPVLYERLSTCYSYELQMFTALTRYGPICPLALPLTQLYKPVYAVGPTWQITHITTALNFQASLCKVVYPSR